MFAKVEDVSRAMIILFSFYDFRAGIIFFNFRFFCVGGLSNHNNFSRKSSICAMSEYGGDRNTRYGLRIGNSVNSGIISRNVANFGEFLAKFR